VPSLHLYPPLIQSEHLVLSFETQFQSILKLTTSFKIIVELHMFYSSYIRLSWKVDSGALNFHLLVFHFRHVQLCKCFFVVSKFAVHCSHNNV
jgi:hypothetical protein